MNRFLKSLVLAALLMVFGMQAAQAALSASGVFEIRSTATASNVNAGYFNPANANFATDAAATSANTDSPVITSASYNFVSGAGGDTNAWFYSKSGTNWNAGMFCKIASVSSNAATLDAAVGHCVSVVNNLYTTNTVAGIATTASPTGGTWGIDYSQQDAAGFADTDLASTIGTTNPCTVTSAAKPFGINMVGNGLHITAGTNWTQAYYEIVSVSGVTATLDKACGSSATLSSGTGKVGGALSLGSSDDAVFELAVSSTTAATRFFIKGGTNITYTINGTVDISAAGNTKWVAEIEGYSSTRGDRPKGSTRPTFSMGANGWTFTGADWAVYSMQFTTTAAAGITLGNRSRIYYSKFLNNSSTAGRAAITGGPASNYYFSVEATSIRGNAVLANTTSFFNNCYIHDSDIGINISSTTAINGCIIAVNFSKGIYNSNGSNAVLTNNTFYGAETPLGIGMDINTSVSNNLYNNIFYGLVTGVQAAASQYVSLGDFNDFFNNTSDVSNYFKGTNDIALAPVFTSVTQRTGTTATTTAGNHLVQTGATFQTWGVTTSDYLIVTAGTGPTAAIYTIASIDSETQITTNETLTANATADKVWYIIKGRDFSIGTNLKATGYPGLFPGGLTTGYTDIGAAQRQEAGGAGAAFSRIFGGF